MHQEVVLTESVMSFAPTSLLTSEMAVLVDTQSLLFLWSASQFFISASRSGHFTVHVCFFFNVSFSELEFDQNVFQLHFHHAAFIFIHL
jgi:hypothetical protein